MSKSYERLTAPVDVDKHEQRVLFSPIKWEYPPEEVDQVESQIQLVLETLKEAFPYVSKVKHIERTSHAYNAEIEVQLEDASIWELRVFSNKEDLQAFKEYLKSIWHLSSEEKVTQRLLIRQLFLVAVTPEVKKHQVFNGFRNFVKMRYQK